MNNLDLMKLDLYTDQKALKLKQAGAYGQVFLDWVKELKLTTFVLD